MEAEATVAREVAAKEVAATVEVATVAAPRVVPNRQYRRRKRGGEGAAAQTDGGL